MHVKYTLIFDQREQNCYKEINSFEFEIFSAMYDCDIDFAERKVFSRFRISKDHSSYLLIRFIFSSRSSSSSRRFDFVVDDLFWIELNWLYIWLSHWLYIWLEEDWVEIDKSNEKNYWKYWVKNHSNIESSKYEVDRRMIWVDERCIEGDWFADICTLFFVVKSMIASIDSNSSMRYVRLAKIFVVILNKTTSLLKI